MLLELLKIFRSRTVTSSKQVIKLLSLNLILKVNKNLHKLGAHINRQKILYKLPKTIFILSNQIYLPNGKVILISQRVARMKIVTRHQIFPNVNHKRNIEFQKTIGYYLRQNIKPSKKLLNKHSRLLIPLGLLINRLHQLFMLQFQELSQGFLCKLGQ